MAILEVLLVSIRSCYADLFAHVLVCIRESVDSLCRDGAGVQYMQCLSKSRITLPQNMQKAHLSVQPSSLSAFMIWKTHIVAQKPRGR